MKNSTVMVLGGSAIALYLYSKSKLVAVPGANAALIAQQQQANSGFLPFSYYSRYINGTQGGSQIGYGIAQAGNSLLQSLVSSNSYQPYTGYGGYGSSSYSYA